MPSVLIHCSHPLRWERTRYSDPHLGHRLLRNPLKTFHIAHSSIPPGTKRCETTGDRRTGGAVLQRGVARKRVRWPANTQQLGRLPTACTIPPGAALHHEISSHCP